MTIIGLKWSSFNGESAAIATFDGEPRIFKSRLDAMCRCLSLESSFSDLFKNNNSIWTNQSCSSHWINTEPSCHDLIDTRDVHVQFVIYESESDSDFEIVNMNSRFVKTISNLFLRLLDMGLIFRFVLTNLKSYLRFQNRIRIRIRKLRIWHEHHLCHFLL